MKLHSLLMEILVSHAINHGLSIKAIYLKEMYWKPDLFVDLVSSTTSGIQIHFKTGGFLLYYTYIYSSSKINTAVLYPYLIHRVYLPWDPGHLVYSLLQLAGAEQKLGSTDQQHC